MPSCGDRDPLIKLGTITRLFCVGRLWCGRSQWPRGLRRRSAAARLLRSWVRIPPQAWISVCCECCVLSGRGLCDELITRPEESYRLWCVVVCDLETSGISEALARVGPQRHRIERVCDVSEWLLRCTRQYKMLGLMENVRSNPIGEHSSVLRVQFVGDIWDFRREVDENRDLLCYYAVISGNFLSTFRNNISVPCSRVRNIFFWSLLVSFPNIAKLCHSLFWSPRTVHSSLDGVLW